SRRCSLSALGVVLGVFSFLLVSVRRTIGVVLISRFFRLWSSLVSSDVGSGLAGLTCSTGSGRCCGSRTFTGSGVFTGSGWGAGCTAGCGRGTIGSGGGGVPFGLPPPENA